MKTALGPPFAPIHPRPWKGNPPKVGHQLETAM
jgi:hypothetical protein